MWLNLPRDIGPLPIFLLHLLPMGDLPLWLKTKKKNPTKKNT
jgi:hypothetical protein